MDSGRPNLDTVIPIGNIPINNYKDLIKPTAFDMAIQLANNGGASDM